MNRAEIIFLIWKVNKDEMEVAQVD